MSTQENVFLKVLWDFPGDSDGKESACNVETQVQSLGVKKIPWRKEWLPTPVFLPGEFHRQRKLLGYSQRGCREPDTMQQLTLTN